MNIPRHEIERRVERFKEVARQAGVKLTHQRLEICRVVAASADHPDAESVLRTLKPRMPTVSLDTVYRTLWLLNDLGLVSTLGTKRESIRFDANLTPHHHFVCVRCGMARDFVSDELDALRIPESVEQLGDVVDTYIEVRGICRRCAKAQAAGGTHHNAKKKKRRVSQRSREASKGADHE